jgi:hypothetical protein
MIRALREWESLEINFEVLGVSFKIVAKSSI